MSAPCPSYRVPVSATRTAAMLDWISARRRPFRVADIACGVEVGTRMAYRWLAGADDVGWVRRERVHSTKVIYHPLVTVQTRGED